MKNEISILIKVAIFSACFFLSFITISQNINRERPHPKFSPFKGNVYEIPIQKTNTGKNGQLIKVGIQEYYSEIIYNYQKIGEITLNEINIPETIIGDGKFPGVDQTLNFAMLLNSKMQIFVDGCYQFSLSSDDGSRLWIDENTIINNDGGHQFKTKIDSVSLQKGIYDVKLWYFQGMPNRFGLVLNAKLIGEKEECPNRRIDKVVKKKKIITLRNLLFDFNTSKINNEGIEELKTMVFEIRKMNPSKIQIIGHTDNLGTEEYNHRLSLKRADKIKEYLQKALNMQNIELIVIGKGALLPIATNKNSEGRKLNRRVELILHK